MKTATEIAKLHALFLSQDPANWELAAMMCSEEDFEAVLRLEVERIKLMDSDINLDLSSILGSEFTWCAGWMLIYPMDDSLFVTFHIRCHFKDLDLEKVKKCWRNKLKTLKSSLA